MPALSKTNRAPTNRLHENPQCGACQQPILGQVIELNGASLQEVVTTNALPMIVDFWAPWCGPCRMFAPTFEAAAKEYGGQLLFTKVNTQEEQEAAATYQIRSIPTLAVFHGGQEIGRVSGALPATQLNQLIDEIISKTTTSA